MGVRVEGALADARRRWGWAAGRPAAASVSGEASVRGGVQHAATSGSGAGAATQRPTLPVFKWWVGGGVAADRRRRGPTSSNVYARAPPPPPPDSPGGQTRVAERGLASGQWGLRRTRGRAPRASMFAKMGRIGAGERGRTAHETGLGGGGGETEEAKNQKKQTT